VVADIEEAHNPSIAGLEEEEEGAEVVEEPSGLGNRSLRGVFTLPFSGGFTNAVGRFIYEESEK